MKIVPGAKFQFGNRSYTVQSVDNGVVEYTLEGPIGKPVTLQRYNEPSASVFGTSTMSNT